jgi:hypothetical protein
MGRPIALNKALPLSFAWNGRKDMRYVRSFPIPKVPRKPSSLGRRHGEARRSRAKAIYNVTS